MVEGDLNRARLPELDGKAAVGFNLGNETPVAPQAGDGEVEQGRRLVEFAARREHARGRRAGFGADSCGIA